MSLAWPTGTFALHLGTRPVTALSRGAVSYREAARHALDAAILPGVREQKDFATEVAGLMDVPTVDLLMELSDDFGLAWSSVAAAVGVSVPALRKWRHGQPITVANLNLLATLVSLCREIRSLGLLEPGEWLERWVWPEVPVRRLQLVSSGHAGVLRALAHNALSPSEALDEVDPQWRERYLVGDMRTEFDVDGRPVIFVS